MAVFLDLDLDDDGVRNNSNGSGAFRLPHNRTLLSSSSRQVGSQPQTSHQHQGTEENGSVRLNANVNGFSAAVACYP